MTHWYNFPLNVPNKLLKYQKIALTLYSRFFDLFKVSFTGLYNCYWSVGRSSRKIWVTKDSLFRI